MTKTPTEYLEEIITKNPQISIENRRELKEDMFILIGKACLKDAGKLYLTSHTPNESESTSYRLWLEKPVISLSGHPDWTQNYNMAIAEMWKYREHHRGYSTDDKVFSKITEESKDAPLFPAPEVIRKGDGWFCNETRIYELRRYY